MSHQLPASNPQEEPTIRSERLYEGRILNVRKDTVRMPNGSQATREIIEHSHAVCIVPVDDDCNVLLVRQYRKPVEESVLEVPAGGVERDEVGEDTVLRELQEEVGYTAARLQHLASFWVAPGWATEYMHSYLATGLQPSKLIGDDDENIEVVRVSLDQALDMIKTGQIHDAKTIASLLLALPFLPVR